MVNRREDKISFMRIIFDVRKWEQGGSFSSHYQEKLLLGNKLNFSEEDLISYLIDELDNPILQSQARMSRYSRVAELLDIMNKLSYSEHNLPRNPTTTVHKQPANSIPATG